MRQVRDLPGDVLKGLADVPPTVFLQRHLLTISRDFGVVPNLLAAVVIPQTIDPMAQAIPNLLSPVGLTAEFSLDQHRFLRRHQLVPVDNGVVALVLDTILRPSSPE